MRFGKYVQGMTRPELVELIGNLNLTAEEERIVLLLAKGQMIVEIAENISVSTSTVCNRIKGIKAKVDRLKQR